MWSQQLTKWNEKAIWIDSVDIYDTDEPRENMVYTKPKTTNIVPFSHEYIGCFKKSFTIWKEYTNLYIAHTQRFELS
jgi:hypothetical protein